MNEKLETKTSGEGENTEWDMSGVDFVGAKIDEKAKRAAYDPEKYVGLWGKEYEETEQQFHRYRESLGREDLTGDAKRRYEISLRRYEEDAALDWERAEGAKRDSLRAGKYLDEYAVAKLQRIGRMNPEDTIEAATGIFYNERRDALKAKILEAGDGEKEKAEIQMLEQTWRKVGGYMDAVYDTFDRSDEYAWKKYDADRRAAHNAMIRHLNSLNDLAREYGVTPFTFRNFMTNDFSYDQRLDDGRALDARVKYDRYSVVEYFKVVFKREFDRKERMRQREEGYFGGGY